MLSLKRSRYTLTLLPLASQSLFAQEGASSQASQSSLWSMISEGGWAMIPLGICSLALIYLIVHCLRETRADRFGHETLGVRLEELCGKGKIEEAVHVARHDPSLLGRAVAVGLAKFDPQAPNESIENVEAATIEQFDLEEHGIGQWIHYVNVIAAVSPMIGLLGTVSGMIGAFQTMSAGGMGRPELFAGDISEALITTATGLCIGIPAMIAHSFLNNRLNNQLVENGQRARAVQDCLLENS